MKKEFFDIITMGSATIDSFVDTGLREKKGIVSYPIGAKIAVKDISFDTGGSGTNTAVAFSRGGLRTGFIGKLGKDEHARMILEELKKEKVEFLGVQGKEPTGYSVILDSSTHERTILSYKGANRELDFKEIDVKGLNTRWFYFSSMIGKSLDAQEKLSEWAEKKRIIIAFNPGSYLKLEEYKQLRNILRRTFVLILNEEEARNFIPHGELIRGLHRLGPKIVCVTKGKEGGIVSNGNIEYKFVPHKIKIKEVTGAGDAFASGFVLGLMKTNDTKIATEYGLLNAEAVIQEPGAKTGLLSWKQLEFQRKNNPVNIF